MQNRFAQFANFLFSTQTMERSPRRFTIVHPETAHLPQPRFGTQTFFGWVSTRWATYSCLERGERFMRTLLSGLAKTPVWVARSNMARACSGLNDQVPIKGSAKVSVRVVPDGPFVGDAISTALVPSGNAPVNEICPDELPLGRKAATSVFCPRYCYNRLFHLMPPGSTDHRTSGNSTGQRSLNTR